jgi:hypothetical protein
MTEKPQAQPSGPILTRSLCRENCTVQAATISKRYGRVLYETPIYNTIAVAIELSPRVEGIAAAPYPELDIAGIAKETTRIPFCRISLNRLSYYGKEKGPDSREAN